mmetsp:Transcript_38738/g.115138  ORF Transcript_38738/g.115138 Transcript_38738/m.115138 type:complete len:250 (-) Transcript_38738:490-1239(-)
MCAQRQARVAAVATAAAAAADTVSRRCSGTLQHIAAAGFVPPATTLWLPRRRLASALRGVDQLCVCCRRADSAAAAAAAILGCRVVAVPGFTIAVAGTIYSARRHWLHAGAAGAIGVAVGADVSAVAVPAVAGAIFAVAAVVAGVDIANTVVYVSRRIAQLPHRLLVVVTISLLVIRAVMKFGGSHLNQRVPVLTLQPRPSPPPHTRPNVPQLVVPQRLDQVVHSSCCEALDDLLMLAACANWHDWDGC